ncbi:hypothetical protein AZE42_04269 [Rhizopogon vesiculosus]|uniref:Haloacid dehalogenase n=1 Tax=Rhizopogon vesiculosus TaxID=180088 RepID=A0A1J8PSI2_9AGAM|nr:hypothetical protein AZE42_04269 [Rhizopogon vesiculosus]
MTSTEDLDVLREIDAYLFDVFGTVLNWHSTLTREIPRRSKGLLLEGGNTAHVLLKFQPDNIQNQTRRMRSISQKNGEPGITLMCKSITGRSWLLYHDLHIHSMKVAQGGEGTLHTDIMHREILDNMLSAPRWSRLADIWGESDREELTMIWHDLDVYEDTVPGLTELKSHVYILTLSNGNFKLLLDQAKKKGLPWDGIFSTEMFGTYKPNKHAYQSAAYHLSLPPHKIAMVAAHHTDLRAAASVGFKTVYVPRPTEDLHEVRNNMRSKKDGGEVDLVVKDFQELAKLVGEARQSR